MVAYESNQPILIGRRTGGAGNTVNEEEKLMDEICKEQEDHHHHQRVRPNQFNLQIASGEG